MRLEQAGADEASADMKRRVDALRGRPHPLSTGVGNADGPTDLAARLQGLRGGGSALGSTGGEFASKPHSSRSIGARVSGVVGRLRHPHKATHSDGASRAVEPTDSDVDSQQLEAIQGATLPRPSCTRAAA